MIVRRLLNEPRFDFGELDRLRRNLEAMARHAEPAGAGVFPPLNITESADSIFVRAELPGLDRKVIDISVEGDQLSISGERKIAEEGESTKYHRRERAAGRFARTVALPTPIEGDRVNASYRLGLLTIELPKAAAARPRKIAIEG